MLENLFKMDKIRNHAKLRKIKGFKHMKRHYFSPFL